MNEIRVCGPDENNIIEVEIPPYIWRFKVQQDVEGKISVSMIGWKTSMEKAVEPSEILKRNAKNIALIRAYVFWKRKRAIQLPLPF